MKILLLSMSASLLIVSTLGFAATQSSSDESAISETGYIVNSEPIPPRLNKLSMSLIARILSGNEPFDTRVSVMIKFTEEKSQEELESLGITPRSVIGKIITAECMLSDVLMLVEREDVIAIEGGRPLYQTTKR
jgi:hypothetical protein